MNSIPRSPRISCRGIRRTLAPYDDDGPSGVDEQPARGADQVEPARDAERDGRVREVRQDDRAEDGPDLTGRVHAAGDQAGVRPRDVLADAPARTQQEARRGAGQGDE